MLQSVIAYGLVAGAAAWVGWSLWLRGWLKRRKARSGPADCGPDCGCHD